MSATEPQPQKKKKKPKFVQEDDKEVLPAPPALSYRAPPGFKLSKPALETKEFDWNEVNNDPDLEIWAIRLPQGLKPKYLENMSIPFPHDGASSGPLAHIRAGKKQKQYDLTIASDLNGAEEMKGFKCLLPSSSDGRKLRLVSQPLAGHILFSETPPDASISNVGPHSSPSSSTLPPLPLPSCTRYSYPLELLKNRYVPTVAPKKQEETEEDMSRRHAESLDEQMATQSTTDPPDSPSTSRPKKRKKDRDDGGSTKHKSKKLKIER
ncbi:hypothetical protein CPB86DRAFT_784948 [Serendipita vermifera]|nr:hypothetical protein CPB86DRAFT_784948 [Serendipita vermifera]